MSSVDSEAIMDVVLSVVEDQSEQQPGSLIQRDDPVTLSAIAFVRGGLRGLFKDMSSSMLAGRRGMAADSPAIMREARGCVVLEMRAAEPTAALLVRRCRSGALSRAARLADRDRGFVSNRTRPAQYGYGEEEIDRLDRSDAEFLRGSKDPDAAKVDPRMSFTVGDSTVKTMLESGASAGRALGRRAAQDIQEDIEVMGCKLLRLVGDGFEPVELYQGYGAAPGGDAAPDGWGTMQSGAGSGRLTSWAAMGGTKARSTRGALTAGSSSSKEQEQEQDRLADGFSPDSPALTESGGGGVASVVAAFGGGIIDLKDAFDSHATEVAQQVPSR